jgi:guanylate kinase
VARGAHRQDVVIPPHALLFVVSAPSGTGKRSVLARAQEQGLGLQYVVSATTRARRPDEVDGRDYIFIDRAAFQRRVEAGDFVEWAEVHGNWYGTLKEQLNRCLATGGDVLLELDVQGARHLRNTPGANIVAVFVMPPSLETLKARLRGRGTNEAGDMAVRLENAREEMAARFEYDYIIVNDVLEDAVADFEAIVRAQRRRSDIVRAREKAPAPVSPS